MLREEPLEPGRLSLSHFEVCALYPGFDNPEWSDLTSEVAQTLQYGEFRLAAWGEVNRVLGGAQRAFVLPGYGVDPEGEARARAHPPPPAGRPLPGRVLPGRRGG